MTIKADDVQWVVNNLAELGVKIGNQFFFLYKGRSLVYSEKGEIAPFHWRPVGKREFGECCHPINYDDLTKVGTVNLNDSDDWLPMPTAVYVPDSDAGEVLAEGPRDDLPDWSKLWICTTIDNNWSQHDGDRFEISENGIALFYLDNKLTGCARVYDNIFRKDLIDIEWLYDQEVEVRPAPEPKPEEKAFTVEIDLAEINKSDVYPTDAEGFYAVTDCLPENLLGLNANSIIYVVLKYEDGTTETGAYYQPTKLGFQIPTPKEFHRSHFELFPNLGFSKINKKVVGWKYR